MRRRNPPPHRRVRIRLGRWCDGPTFFPEILSMKQVIFAFLFAVALSASSAQAQSPDIFDAARADNPKVVQALINSKADVNQVDEQGYTALILAAYNGSPNVAELLLQHGASPEVRDQIGRTALMGAAVQGDPQCIKLLLDHGAKILSRVSSIFFSLGVSR